jgi:hypothetical protein
MLIGESFELVDDHAETFFGCFVVFDEGNFVSGVGG